jgi:hypothetical protein
MGVRQGLWTLMVRRPRHFPREATRSPPRRAEPALHICRLTVGNPAANGEGAAIHPPGVVGNGAFWNVECPCHGSFGVMDISITEHPKEQYTEKPKVNLQRRNPLLAHGSANRHSHQEVPEI